MLVVMRRIARGLISETHSHYLDAKRIKALRSWSKNCSQVYAAFDFYSTCSKSLRRCWRRKLWGTDKQPQNTITQRIDCQTKLEGAYVLIREVEGAYVVEEEGRYLYLYFLACHGIGLKKKIV
jgi:hypothetical protein